MRCNPQPTSARRKLRPQFRRVLSGATAGIVSISLLAGTIALAAPSVADPSAADLSYAAPIPIKTEIASDIHSEITYREYLPSEYSPDIELELGKASYPDDETGTYVAEPPIYGYFDRTANDDNYDSDSYNTANNIADDDNKTFAELSAVAEQFAAERDKCDFEPGSSVYRPNVYLCGFPVIRLDSPQYLSRDKWRPATLNIGNTSAEFMMNNVDVSIRGRGNSTWLGMGDKRPLRFRFPNNQWQALFDAEAVGRDWLLVASVADPSFLRNYGAFELGRLLGTMPFTLNSWFVHLYLDSEYRGVYLLTEERDATPGRGNVNLHPDPTISEYMIEHEFRVRYEAPVNSNWVAIRNNSFEIRHAGGNLSTVGNPHALYVHDFLSRVDAAILSGDQERIAALVNIPSIVDSYLIHELFRDMDTGITSQFFQIRGTGANRRLYSGPLWDFDRSSGSIAQAANVAGLWAGRRVNPSAYWLDWYQQLITTDWFRALVAERWSEVYRDQLPAWLAHLDQVSVQFAGGFDRNFERWPTHLRMEHLDTPGRGHHGPASVLTSARAHRDFLLDWLQQRGSWLYNYFGNRALIGGEVVIRGGAHVGSVLRVDVTAPFVSNVTGRPVPERDLQFQWYRGGTSPEHQIVGATSRTFRVTAADVGQRIFVQVRATAAGYQDAPERQAVSAIVRVDPLVSPVTRIAGADRFDTAKQIKDYFFDNPAAVFIARGSIFPDALAATSAAQRQNAPVLLYGGAASNAATLARVRDLGVRQVYIIGGTAAVSLDFEAQLSQLADVTRIAGEHRYETALDVAREFFADSDTMFVATGQAFPDALAAGAAAGRVGAPVLLADSIEHLNAAIEALPNVKNVYIIGGNGAVSATLEAELRRHFGSDNVERVWGQTRFETAAAIAWRWFLDAERVILASANDHPDALAGAAAAGQITAPVLLVGDSGPFQPGVTAESLSAPLLSYLTGVNPAHIYLLGGESALHASVYLDALSLFGLSLDAGGNLVEAPPAPRHR